MLRNGVEVVNNNSSSRRVGEEVVVVGCDRWEFGVLLFCFAKGMCFSAFLGFFPFRSLIIRYIYIIL
jgi:hypothetical protein